MDKGKLLTRFYYGWYIIAASFIMLSLNSAAQFSIGVMFKPIIFDFGWNRAEISLAVLTNMTIFAFSMLAMGKAYDQFGPKWVIIFSATFMGAGLVGVSKMDSLFEFHLYYGLFCGVGFSGTTALIFTALISKWFEKNRGFAISLALSGGRLGQFFLIPVYTGMVMDEGWKPTYFLIGIVTFGVNVILAILIVKGDPEQLGYRSADGKSLGSNKQKTTLIAKSKKSDDLGFKAAARTASFWIYVGVMLICGAGDFFVTTHLVPFITDFGVSQKTAGNMLAWLGLFSLFGVLIAGTASDFIGNKLLITGTFIIRVLLFILILNYQNEVVFYIFSLGFGFTLMITAVLTVTLIGKMYGFSNIGTLTGFITTIHHLAGGLLIYLGGFVFDKTSSYQPVFLLYTFLSLLAVGASLFINEKRHLAD